MTEIHLKGWHLLRSEIKI